MRVNVLYVVSFASDAEATVATVALFHRHAPNSDSALGVYAIFKDNNDGLAGTLYEVGGLSKGDPPKPVEVKTNPNLTDFNDAIKKAPKTDFTTPRKVYEKRASVGMYLVSHGSLPVDTGNQASKMVKTVEPLIQASGPGNLKVVCLARCMAVPEKGKELHEKKLPSKVVASQTIIENMLLQFKLLGCKPLITGWAAAITASSPPDPDDQFDDNPIPHGAKVLLKDRYRTHLFPDDRRPTREDRDTYKFGYYLNNDDKIIALPAGQIQSTYLSR